MANTYGKPKNRAEDEQSFVPLAVEVDGPVRITDRLNESSVVDRKGRSLVHDLSHAEKRRMEAHIWKIEHGISPSMLVSFRTISHLEGALHWVEQRMLGKARDEARGDIMAEINRRRRGGKPVPLKSGRSSNSFGKQKKQSPGRPTKASLEIPLRLADRPPTTTRDDEVADDEQKEPLRHAA